ncbi:hypothetical protein [Oceanicoccus sp. KOV_DT_Chl]|nr:hypothetical protein [Oceanicoccus sp. KOV_DT_Chl]
MSHFFVLSHIGNILMRHFFDDARLKKYKVSRIENLMTLLL